MRRYVPLIAMMSIVLVIGTADNISAQEPHLWPLDSLHSHSLCMANHFTGIVYDCDNNPHPGITVTLTCPNGSVETDVTNSEGKYCFARAISFPPGHGWSPGHYGLTAGCLGRLVYREGDGDIEVDLSSCCTGK